MSPLTEEEGRIRPLLELVRAADRDRYLAALYAPEDKRADFLALYAFNAEISGVRDRISQALRERGVIVEAIATGGAVRTYNVLMAEKRAVGAALIAVDKAR